jgi:hypothetical protein
MPTVEAIDLRLEDVLETDDGKTHRVEVLSPINGEEGLKGVTATIRTGEGEDETYEAEYGREDEVRLASRGPE